MLTVNKVENKYVVSFYNTNKLNVLNAAEIESKLMPLVSQRDFKLIINFTGIKFIDSSGFELLTILYKESKLNNSVINFINLSEELLELVELVQLDEIFQTA